MENKIGAHYSMDEILTDKINTDYVQFCTGSPMTVKRSLDTEYLRSLNKKLRETTDITKNVIHAAYTINLCNSEYNEWTIRYLVSEVMRCNFLNVKYLIIHGGSLSSKDREIDYQEATKNFAEVLAKVCLQTENYSNVKLCLETMPGKKNQFLSNLKHFKDLFAELHSLLGDTFNERIGVCYDTCHYYDSINGERFDDVILEFYKSWFETFIKVVHLNNSSLSNGKYKDRHKNLVEGVIPSESISKVYEYYSKKNIPIILETPKEGYEGDIRFIKDIGGEIL